MTVFEKVVRILNGIPRQAHSVHIIKTTLYTDIAIADQMQSQNAAYCYKPPVEWIQYDEQAQDNVAFKTFSETVLLNLNIANVRGYAAQTCF